MEDLQRQPAEVSSCELEDLLRRACPSSSRSEAFYLRMMDVAKSQGLSYPQALQFVIGQRQTATLSGHPVDCWPD